MVRLEVLDQVDYCIYCHDRDKDSCSKGLRDVDKATKAVTLKKNPLGISLGGCPLDEKNLRDAHPQAAGRPHRCPGAGDARQPHLRRHGHRICNDCMKGCIYQKQQPVNIPQIETGVLTDVLNMPWGVEIYGLLTRWNPLNAQRPYALPYNGRNVLVVGLGPAGYTLSHYLLNEGFGVVAIDGLKIEPLPEEIVGRPASGAVPAVSPRPIQSWSEIYRPLDERVLEGFGGVSEYGITVRWDKNFLKVIRLLTLERRSQARKICTAASVLAAPWTLDEAMGDRASITSRCCRRRGPADRYRHSRMA